MLRKLLRWLIEEAGSRLVGAILGSAVMTAIVSWAIRETKSLSWEAMWVVWTIAALVSFVALLFALKRWFPITPKETAALPSAESDQAARDLLLTFNREANEAIVKLRDGQGNAVNEDLRRFRDFAISVGRWAGRVEYLAGQLREAFPNEVSAFEVYGNDDINYDAPTGFPITSSTKHLQAVLTKKVERLRKLTAAMQEALRRK